MSQNISTEMLALNTEDILIEHKPGFSLISIYSVFVQQFEQIALVLN